MHSHIHVLEQQLLYTWPKGFYCHILFEYKLAFITVNLYFSHSCSCYITFGCESILTHLNYYCVG